MAERGERMKWKYLLFDLDGTVTDPREGILACVKYAYEAAGLEVPPDETLFAYIGPPLADGFQEIAGMTYEEAVEAVAKYRERYSVTGLFENRVYDGMEEALGSLKEMGYVIAMATSKPEVYALRILEHFGLGKYFDQVVGSTLDGSRNRKGDVVRETLRRLGLSEEETGRVIMIGDRKHDIIGAKECGIASLGVYYGYAPPGELEEYEADYVIHSVDELVPFFSV